VTTRNELIKQQHDIGTTSIYVTHDQVEAMTMGHSICIMNEGRVVQIGRPLEVYRNPADTFVAKFLGNPPMNLLKGRLETQDGRAVAHLAGSTVVLPKRTAAALVRYIGRDVTIGVRPEDLYESAPAGGSVEVARLPARVLVVEPLGSHALVTVLVGKTAVKVQAPIDVAVRPDQAINLQFDEATLRWMDAGTGSAIQR